MNYSTARALAKKVLGPTARVWSHQGNIEVGTERDGVRTIVGEGLTFLEALRDCFDPGVLEDFRKLVESKLVSEKSTEPDSNADGA